MTRRIAMETWTSWYIRKPFKSISSFLNDRHQRIVLNGQRSDLAPILAGVPQGSILGLLSF